MSYHHDTILSDLESRGKVPSREKFRRMICQTFLSNGCCPYYDKYENLIFLGLFLNFSFVGVCFCTIL